jgi:hypothetical protein
MEVGVSLAHFAAFLSLTSRIFFSPFCVAWGVLALDHMVQVLVLVVLDAVEVLVAIWEGRSVLYEVVVILTINQK